MCLNKFETIINVLVSSFRLIILNTYVMGLRLYGH